MSDGRGRGVGRGVLTPPQGMAAVDVAACLCGHGHDCHQHWRRGSDCGSCGTGACTAYRPLDGVVRRLLRGVGLIG